jgi:hypothetical protein
MYSATYRAMIEKAALDMESALKRPDSRSDLTLWAVPTVQGRNGFLHVGYETPAPDARVVRPGDNYASSWATWWQVPYSALADILARACRHEPILPLD